VKALCLLGSPELEASVRLALRLRWPDADVTCLDDRRAFLRTASAVDVAFLDDTSPGFDLVREARAAAGECGLIVLTASPSDEEMLDALDAGADDYLSLPLSPALLIARLGALLRRITRSTGDGESVVRCGPLDINPGTHEAFVHGKALRLTPTEFNLLHHLAVARGGTMTAKALQKLVWECDEPIYLDTLRKYVQRLRKKLVQVSEPPELGIVAIRGVGYRLAYPHDSGRSA
jgi:DNA-binding response OmpR family regulator